MNSSLLTRVACVACKLLHIANNRRSAIGWWDAWDERLGRFVWKDLPAIAATNHDGPFPGQSTYSVWPLGIVLEKNPGWLR